MRNNSDFTTLFAGWWVLEIVSLLLSTICVVAIAFLVSRFDGKPTTSWTFYITINTIVSVLGTIARSTLVAAVAAGIGQGKWLWFRQRPHPISTFEVIDNASRGFTGSFKLLVHTRGRHSLSIGAFVMILSVTMGPSLQSLITTYGAYNEGNSYPNSTIGGAYSLDGGSAIISEVSDANASSDGNTYASYKTYPDLNVTAAYYTGLNTAQTGAWQDLRYTCATGNCTWDPFVSMAICSKCYDVTERLQRTHHVVDSYESEFISDVYILEDLSHLGMGYGDYTNYNLSEYQVWINNNDDYRVGSGTAGDPWTGIAELMTAAVVSDPLRTFNFRDYESLIASYAILKPNVSYAENKTTWANTPVYATECSLYLCLNAYNSTVNQGTLDEQILGTSRQKVPNSWQPFPQIDQPYSVNIDNTTVLGSLDWNPIDTAGYVKRSDFQLDPSSLQVPHQLDTSSTWNATQTFLISTIDTISMDFQMLGMHETPPVSVWIGEEYNTSDSWRIPYKARLEFPSSVSLALYQSDDLNKTFEAVAASLTTLVRYRGTQVNGKTEVWEVYFKIRWVYITFSLLATSLGTLFVLLSSWESYRSRLTAWKTNSLATIIYTADEETRLRLGEACTTQDLNSASRETEVIMRSDTSGIMLSMWPPPEYVEGTPVPDSIPPYLPSHSLLPFESRLGTTQDMDDEVDVASRVRLQDEYPYLSSPSAEAENSVELSCMRPLDPSQQESETSTATGGVEEEEEEQNPWSPL